MGAAANLPQHPVSSLPFQGQLVVVDWPPCEVVVDWVEQPPGGPGMVVLVVVWLEPSGAVVVVVDVPGGGGTAGVVVVVVVVVLPSELTVVLVESANAADARTSPAIARNPARIGAIVVRLMRISFIKEGALFPTVMALSATMPLA